MSFDQSINRKTYPTMKWHNPSLKDLFGNEDVLPFWVADMDFPAPDMIIENLQKRVAHGIFGYEYFKESYFDALTNW